MTGSEDGEREGGRFGSLSQYSNTGHPKRSGAVCQCTAHKAIGADHKL